MSARLARKANEKEASKSFHFGSYGRSIHGYRYGLHTGVKHLLYYDLYSRRNTIYFFTL